jgi:hypothetical protein
MIDFIRCYGYRWLLTEKPGAATTSAHFGSGFPSSNNPVDASLTSKAVCADWPCTPPRLTIENDFFAKRFGR